MEEFIFARSAKGLELKTLEWWGNSQAWQEEEGERSHFSCTQKMKEGARGRGQKRDKAISPRRCARPYLLKVSQPSLEARLLSFKP